MKLREYILNNAQIKESWQIKPSSSLKNDNFLIKPKKKTFLLYSFLIIQTKILFDKVKKPILSGLVKNSRENTYWQNLRG